MHSSRGGNGKKEEGETAKKSEKRGDYRVCYVPWVPRTGKKLWNSYLRLTSQTYPCPFRLTGSYPCTTVQDELSYRYGTHLFLLGVKSTLYTGTVLYWTMITLHFPEEIGTAR